MFSIIIPVYNREKTILRAVRSALNQSFSIPFEVIIVDDCSNDETYNLVREINEAHLRVFRLEENSGPAVARNFGIKMSQYSLISFLDSDDYFEPNFLTHSFEHISQASDGVGFMWTGIRLHQKGKSIEQVWSPLNQENTYETFLNHLGIGTSAGITVKKEVFEKCGVFREDLLAAEDTEFFLRISKSYHFSVCERILINIFRSDDDRLSKNYEKIAMAYNLFLPEHFSSIDKRKKWRYKYYYKMMWLNFHIGETGKSKLFFKKIPLIGISTSLKVYFTFLFYYLLPLKVAFFIHRKISKI